MGGVRTCVNVRAGERTKLGSKLVTLVLVRLYKPTCIPGNHSKRPGKVS